jgi:glutamyl-tRNA synthetase
MTVITRFSPSPTGYLHIGGARTALFNWLYAKHTGGQFLLRIEDTDKERSTPEATQAILDGLKWLGLEWDGATHFQSEYAPRHAELAKQLLEKGKAYYCYCSPQELETMREEARAKGHPIRSPWRDRNPLTGDAPEGVAPTIRIKAPLEGSVTIDDAVQGSVTIDAKQLDDFIILRSDGSPTYMHAVVVDDHDMGVTHIIRGDDHLNNAFRQRIIYEGMGWDVPIFAHIPLIHGPDGAKLSKRHGALGVEAYRDLGYLPEALRNYLLRLGWSHGDDEIISDAQAVEWFDISDVNKAPARIDFDKLANVNGHYIREADDARLAELVKAILIASLRGGEADAAIQPQPQHRSPRPFGPRDDETLLRAMPGLKARAKTLVELADAARFYFEHRAPEDDKAAKQLSDGRELLQRLIPTLEAVSEWAHDALMETAKQWAEANQLKLGAVMSPIRVAITGSTASPSMFEVMEILGKDESLARLKAVTG